MIDTALGIKELEATLNKYIENVVLLNMYKSKLGNLSQLSEINKYRREFGELVENQEAQIIRMKRKAAQEKEARLVDAIVELAGKIKIAQTTLNNLSEVRSQAVVDFAMTGESKEQIPEETKEECLERLADLVNEADFQVKSLKREMRSLAQ